MCHKEWGLQVVGEEEKGGIVGVLGYDVHHAHDGAGGCDAASFLFVDQGLDVGVFEVVGVVSEGLTEGIDLKGTTELGSFGTVLGTVAHPSFQ